MAVGQGESGKETNRYAADLTLATTVADPVVTLVVRLFRSPAVANDGVASTQRTPAKELARTGCPVGAGLAIIPRTWDKRNRNCFRGSLTEADLARMCAP